MNKFPYKIIIIFLIIPYFAHSQANRWKRYRYEFFGGIGASGMLGDLGGSDKIGTHYVKDIDFSMTRPAITAGGRYFILKRVAVQSALSYTWLRGSDTKTQELFRNNRNIQVLTPLVEWQARVEYTILTEKTGHRYNIKNVRGILGNKVSIQIFGGAAFFYFYPMGKDTRPGGSGKFYGLRNVGTEGQNLGYDARKPYSYFSFSVPLGFQVKYIINRKWSVAWEIGLRTTITDYLDDVSKTYVDPDAVAAKNQNKHVDPTLANYLADPSYGRANNIDPHVAVPNKNTTEIGQQRGNNRNFDSYFLSFFTLNYKVRTGRNGLPIFK